jgi:hypothetical protein
MPHFCHEELIAILSALPFLGLALTAARCWCGKIIHKKETNHEME